MPYDSHLHKLSHFMKMMSGHTTKKPSARESSLVRSRILSVLLHTVWRSLAVQPSNSRPHLYYPSFFDPPSEVIHSRRVCAAIPSNTIIPNTDDRKVSA